jgi:preprotein translocase subunit SecA
MTGTAATEAEELAKIYHLEVVSVPTHRPSQRLDQPDLIYKTEAAKFQAIVERVKELRSTKQPVLIGTVSINKSERLARLLKVAKIDHTVLNAKFHQREGEVVAQAGRPGAVTVATNMAGRGVDIILGGAPPPVEAPKASFNEWEKAHQEVLAAGGLMVIGTERHESRRIDNQLRGRSGRQGDPGQSQFYVSMEDDLMRIFGGERMKVLMDRFNFPEDMSIQNSLINRAIEQAQSRVEGHNFDLRKQLVEYDDVNNKQREAIYRRRRTILEAITPELQSELHAQVLELMSPEEKLAYAAKFEQWPPELRGQIEQSVCLRAIDILWVEHLKNLEALRDSINLRGYGQREPIVEYKQEAYNLYNQLNTAIDRQIVDILLHAQFALNPSPTPAPAETTNPLPVLNNRVSASAPPSGKIGRNDPCPCGAIDPKTGKVYKYKKCGLINAPYHRG